MDIGKKIRELRTEKGLTQKKLASISHVSENAINQYERGKRQPKSAYLKKIAEALGVSTDELLGIKENDSLGTRMAIYRNNNIPPEDMNLSKCLDEIDEKCLLEDFRKLNFIGRQEASKRVSELTMIDKYTNKEGE